MEPDSGTTNSRNVNSAQRKRWLGQEDRCLVPFDIRNRTLAFPAAGLLGAFDRRAGISAACCPSSTGGLDRRFERKQNTGPKNESKR
jgi:hypothetical protein